MEILALAIIGLATVSAIELRILKKQRERIRELATVSAIELHILKKQRERIRELEADKRVCAAFDESEEQENE